LRRLVISAVFLSCLVSVAREASSQAPPQNNSESTFSNVEILFRTEPPTQVVFVYDYGTGTTVELKRKNGRAVFPILATRNLSLKFGLRAQMWTTAGDSNLLHLANDPLLYARSKPYDLTGAQVRLMYELKEWPKPGTGPESEPIQLEFEPPDDQRGDFDPKAVLAFMDKDKWAVRTVYYFLPSLFLAVFAALMWRFYKQRVVEPQQKLLELEKRKEEMRQTLAMQRTQNKDNNLGAEFGAYTIDKFLGAGGMARVYRALPTASLEVDKRVAIKVMSDSNASAEFKKRFLREAEVGSSLTHPAVIRIDDYGDANGTLYLVMEFINGETLRERMGPQGMSGAAAWKLLEPVFKGLSYVHERGIIHRDLKPENIMVTETGRIVIMDFGLARRYDHSMLTATGDILGTPAYMSPEQISGNIEPGGGCDQYAIAVMIYEMLTGQLPFPGLTDPVKLLMANLNNKPSPIRQIRADLSQELENALLKMLSKNPASRFESMAECGRVLEPLILAVKSPGPQ
jgi:predicted Ser/Thr protein kinase